MAQQRYVKELRAATPVNGQFTHINWVCYSEDLANALIEAHPNNGLKKINKQEIEKVNKNISILSMPIAIFNVYSGKVFTIGTRNSGVAKIDFSDLNQKKLTERFNGAKQIVIEFQNLFEKNLIFFAQHAAIQQKISKLLLSGNTSEFIEEPQVIIENLKQEIAALKKHYKDKLSFYRYMKSSEREFLKAAEEILDQNPDKKKLVSNIQQSQQQQQQQTTQPQMTHQNVTTSTTNTGSSSSRFARSQSSHSPTNFRIGIKQNSATEIGEISTYAQELAKSIARALRNFGVGEPKEIGNLYVIEVTKEQRNKISAALRTSEAEGINMEYNDQKYVFNIKNWHFFPSEIDYNFVEIKRKQENMMIEDSSSDISDEETEDYSNRSSTPFSQVAQQSMMQDLDTLANSYLIPPLFISTNSGVSLVPPSLPQPQELVVEPEVKEKYDEDEPDDFICPITQEIMKNPVMIVVEGSYQTFEKTAIEKWFDEGKNTCPLTRVSFTKKDLAPNLSLRKAIEAWKEKHKNKQEEKITTDTKTPDSYLGYNSKGAALQGNNLNSTWYTHTQTQPPAPVTDTKTETVEKKEEKRLSM